MTQKLILSIIVPAYNEQLLLAKFISNLEKELNLADLPYELIVVENGSRDKTWDLLKERANLNPRIIPLRIPYPSYGEAVLTGINKARGKYLVIFNVDFWDKRFLHLAKVDLLNADIISSSKLLPGSLDLRSSSRKFVTFMFTKYLNLFLGFKGTDTHGIKIMNRKNVLPIVRECILRNGIFDSELIIRAQRHKLKILELPVRVEELRSPRFSFKRWVQTPKDIFELTQALKK